MSNHSYVFSNNLKTETDNDIKYSGVMKVKRLIDLLN